VDTNAAAEAVRHPATTTRRALEDLTAHGLVECERQGQGMPHLWSQSGFSQDRLGAFPEMASNTRSEKNKGSVPALTFRESADGAATGD
jgi:hypothetical protein